MGKGTRLFWKCVGASCAFMGAVAIVGGGPFVGLFLMGCGLYILWDFRGW
jgi:hypothetical protein